jgi:hypothetical protein
LPVGVFLIPDHNHHPHNNLIGRGLGAELSSPLLLLYKSFKRNNVIED